MTFIFKNIPNLKLIDLSVLNSIKLDHLNAYSDSL